MTELSKPLVTAIIPVYNREDTIIRCIESALSQTYDNIEIIVIDDGSTDGTIESIQLNYSDEITLIEHAENKGGSAARNTGIDESKGEFIAFLDSDDVWEPEKIEHQVEILTSKTEQYVGIYSDASFVSQNILVSIVKNLTNHPSSGACTARGILALQEKIGGASTLLLRRSTIKRIDGFDPAFGRHQDYEFLVRCLAEGEMIHLPVDYVTKFETNYADVQSVTKSKILLFKKFSDEIAFYEKNGTPITKYHLFDLSRCHLRNGSIRKSIQLLIKSKPPTQTDVFSFGKAGIDRITGTISNYCKNYLDI